MAGVRFQYYTPKIEMPKINTFNMVSKLGETAVNALDRWNLNSAIQKTFGDQGAEKPQSPPAVQNAMSMLTAPTPEQPPSPVEKAKRLLIDGPNPQNTPQSFAENKTDSLITGGPQGQTPQTIARPGETPPQAMSRLIAEHGQGENTGPGEQTLETIRKFEGYSDKPYWDVNAHRTGYGSDTVTLADNSVQRVRPGMKITREDAERDLTRRVGDFQSGIVKKIGQDNWMNMPENGKAALTSVAYNYGSLPDSVAKAAMTPGLEDDAAAIANLQGHNGGVNRNRRLQEAKLMLGTGGVGGDPDVPVAGGAQAGFTIPRQAGLPPAYPGSTQPPIDTRALAQILSNPQASPALQQAFISRAGGGKPQENWQFVNTNQGMGRFNQVTGQLEMMPGTQARDAVAIGGRLVDRNTGDVIYKPEPSEEGMFSGNSVEAQGYNHLIRSGALTPDQAATMATGKTVTGSDGAMYFMTPQGVFQQQGVGQPPKMVSPQPGQPSQGQPPAQPGAPGIQLTPPKTKTMNEGQANAALYSDRMDAADKILSNPEIYQSTMGAGGVYRNMMSSIPGIGNAVAGFTPDGSLYQMAQQAKLDFMTAALRRESGAAITPSEYEKADKQYFPQVGDSNEVLTQKAQNRRLATDGIRRAAGEGYSSSQSQPQPSPQQQPVRVMSPQDARRYPSGTPIQMPDGTIGRVP